MTVDMAEVEAQLADCLTALLGGIKSSMAVDFSLQLTENCVFIISFPWFVDIY